jgi:hypothetical protein
MTITIPRKKRPLKLKGVKLSANKIQAIIEQEVAASLQHFNDEEIGGWRLDKNYLRSQILYKVFDVLIEDEIDQAFINVGLCVSYGSDGNFVELKEGYKPIYFNEKTGKLKVVENSDDNSYLYRYSSKKNWVHIGRL